MTVHTVERIAMDRLNRIMPAYPEDAREDRLPLHHELFLICHDDETGRRHISERVLSLGLAAAILLELWLLHRIHVGWRFDVRSGGYLLDEGRVSVLRYEKTGDPILDSALTTLWELGPRPQVRDFVKRFAADNLYERVQGYLVAAQVIQRETRKRFLFFRTDIYLPVDSSRSVRARTAIRDLVDRHRQGSKGQPGEYGVLALAGLAWALGLASHLIPMGMTPAAFHRWLEDLLDNRPSPTIRDVIGALRRRRSR
ncbi:MAG TPA: GPP34 family phosphoprotein [Micromonosporaceae bacterium]|jgi:hypothetical protein|nr:GPP34 family phosphoprotein [Micromonosporaceae bacterium]